MLSDQRGALEVEVLMDGKPLPRAPVGVWIEGMQVREQWARGGDPYDEQSVYPVLETDENGIVRFDHLIPGNYQIRANEGKPSNIPGVRGRLSGWNAAPQCDGRAVGVAVKNGTVTRYRLAIYRTANHQETQTSPTFTFPQWQGIGGPQRTARAKPYLPRNGLVQLDGV